MSARHFQREAPTSDPSPAEVADPIGLDGLARLLGLDRRTVAKRLAGLEPVAVRRKAGLYRLADAVRACFGHPTLVEEAALRRRREVAQTERAETELAARRGELVPKGEVARAIAARAKAERDAHMAFVLRLAPVLAGELGCDASRLHAALDREMREHLRHLAATPLPELLTDG